MEEQESKSWMREAYNATIQVFNTRIKRYKALIISIAVAVLVSIIWAIVWKSWSPLLCLIIPIQLCGIFFSSDLMLIGKWQNIVLNLWINDELDIGLFIDTVSQVRMLPKATLQSLLKTLPERELANKASKEIRESLKITLETINYCQVDKIVFSTCAFSLGLGFLAFALIHWSWIALLGLVFVVMAFAMSKVSCYIRLGILKRKIKRQKMDLRIFVEIADRLDWGTSRKGKEYILNLKQV